MQRSHKRSLFGTNLVFDRTEKGGTMAEWIVTNCESVGNTHDVCQDHTEYMISNNVYVGALADGVSNNRHSDEGAKAVTLISCQEMCENFKKYYSGELSSRDFVQKIQKKMNLKYAKEYDLNQMKSTLLLCAIYDNNYVIGHIGDGAVLCFGKESYVISPPQENEVGGTATYTILDCNADEHFRFKVGNLDELDGFLITSDGLLGNVYYSGIDIPQLAYELFGSVYKKASPSQKEERDAQFKTYLAEHIQRGNDLADDCSLFMIARKKQTGYVDYDALNGFEADVKWPCECGNTNRMDEIRCSNCQTMYTALYPATIIRINSKEGFFSKLNKWIASNSGIEFNPGVTAEIIDPDRFTFVCKALKIAMLNKAISREETITNSLNNTQGIVDGLNKAERKISSQTSSVHQKQADVSGNIIECVAKFSVSAIKKGLQLISEAAPKYSKRQKSKGKTVRDKAIIQKVFPIVLSYEQMVEAAYQLEYLPMVFGNTDESIDINCEMKKIVDAMFTHESFFDLFQNDDEDTDVIHYYQANNRTFAVYDDKTSDFYCADTNNIEELLNDSLFLPRSCFLNEIQKCNKRNVSLNKFRKVVLHWDWISTYVYSKADAAQMLCILLGILDKQGYQLDEVIANVWFVAGNKDSIEMVAYLLTNCYLIRLKSVDQKHVEVDQVAPSDDCALQLREKYLISKL